MSQKNVEVVRTVVAALNRGDLDGALAHASSDFEFDASRGLGPTRGVYGREQARRAWEDFADTWGSVRLEADFIDAGEHVVTPHTIHFTGRDGIEVQARTVWVWTIRGSAVARICLYQECQEALEAVGLRE